MSLAWLGLYLLSCTWLLAAGAYEPTDRSWPYLAVAGVVILAMSFPGLRFDRIPWRVYLLAAGPAVFTLMIPHPYKIVGIVPLAGFILLLACHKIPRLTPLAAGLLVAGAALVLQSLALALFYFLSPNLKDAGFAAPALYAMLEAVGSDVSLGDGIVYVGTVPEIMRLWPTWDHLGLFHALLLFSGALPLVRLSRSPRRGFLVLIALIPAYFLLRYGVFSVVEASGTYSETYWSNIWNAISLLPLYLILSALLPIRRFEDSPPARLGGLTLKPSQTLSAACLAAAVFALTCYTGLADSGVVKRGRILMDEYHSDWEWTDQEFDTQWYGIKSGYNYYNLYEYLNYFYHADRGDSRFTGELLSNYDVLILKTPTRRIESDEIEAIVKFVEDGGGLWLLGDHTNVFGTSTYLNELCGDFGFRFRFDSTYDLSTGNLTVIVPPRILPHVVVQNMPVFMFATSCTIEGGPFTRPAQNGYRLRTVAADYSQTSFFPEKKEHRDYGFGLFIQTICAKPGKGRVCGFTDSTVFSNFFMYIPGKPELVLGTMEWLNRRNRHPWMEAAFAAAGVLFLLLFAFFTRKDRPAPRALLGMATLTLALPLSIWAVSSLNARNYPPPEPHTDFTRVSFEKQHSFFFVPIVSLTSNHQNDFQTFYVWTQRLGLVPNVSWSVEQATANGDLVVFIDPRLPFSAGEAERLKSYVAEGGNILVLDDRRNVYSTSNQLLSFFGMRMDTTRVALTAEDSVSAYGPLFDKAGSIEGGTPMVATAGGEAVISYVERDKGMVMACSNSHLFELKSMGATGAIPNPRQRLIYETQFDMLRKLLDLE